MKLKSVSVVVTASALLAACGSGGKLSPNEFEVVSRAPLIVPPEATLTPPRPGQSHAQQINPTQQAFEALFPGKRFRRQLPKSSSELSLLRQLPSSEPDVRSNVGFADVEVVKKTLLLADLLEIQERQFGPDDIEIARLSSDTRE
jgi:predicted small lipoprotein YifL